MTLEESIQKHSVATPDKIAVICGDSRISYSGLWDSILKRSSELQAEGLKPHRPYVYRATQDINFVVTYCAVHYLEAIAVPLETRIPEKSFQTIRKEVESSTFEDGIRDILYTTGTTGKSKGVMLSETALVSCADNFVCDFHLSPELLFIISGPLSHIASLFKMHPILTVGGTICVLDGLKDMNAFFDVFDLPFTKFATFLVPASIRLLMQFSYDRLCSLADKIDFIETGAAPISSHDMEQLSKALPHSRLYNTLGGTEIGAVCTYDFNDGRYIEGCIGRPMKNSTVEIGPEGNLIISGPTIMSGYVADEENTRRVLQDGKIHSADIGFMDENGMIHLKGRSGDVINVGGFKVDPVEVENAASAIPGIKDCICVPASHPVIGTVLKLLVVLSDDVVFDRQAIARELKKKLEPHKVPTYYEKTDSIRRTYNGKLDRKYYRQ